MEGGPRVTVQGEQNDWRVPDNVSLKARESSRAVSFAS
jgi:hypothetical protein